MWAALQDGSALSGFCALDATAEPTWISWADLLAQPDIWRTRAAEVRGVLSVHGAPVDQRVVASLVHLGLVARLLCPTMGAALVGGVLPVVAASGVQLQLRGPNPLPMTWAGVTGVEVHSPREVAQRLAQHWLEPLVQPWSDLIARDTGLSRRVLLGNVASAAAGALGLASTRSELRDRSEAILDALLITGPLADTGRRRTDRSFLRHSCCLLYRLPGAGTCGDCILTTTSRAQR